MANEENLKPFQKGNKFGKGSPKGSPNRSKPILDILSLEQDAVNPVTKNEERLNQLQLIGLAMLKKARSGDVRAAQFLIDNGYGKLTENFEVNQIGENTGSLKDLLSVIRTENKD